jgi:murein L,D-transpeptidase YafK
MKKIGFLFFALLLTGCAGTGTIDSKRGYAAQNSSIISASERAGANAKSPVLIRIFKQSKELELWRKTANKEYVLVKTYPICAFSGNIGPKHKQGDRQAPEGFYSIGPSQLNYNSIRFLSLDTGYPNAYDRAHGSTGSALMIHGGCDSAGCYAIEDAPAQELFTVVRDALKAGQNSVQLQIYPFRMSDWTMIVFSKDKNIDFWRQLKVGYDRFNNTHTELAVSVSNGRYFVN